MHRITKRHFLKTTGAFLTMPLWAESQSSAQMKISLAQWSLHKALFSKKLDNLDFPAFTAETFGIHAVEWVNSFFSVNGGKLGKQPKPESYLKEMKQRTEDAGVKTLLIMCDGVGSIGDPDAAARTRTIDGHKAWLEAVKFLGGHSIRVNASSAGSPQEQAKLCVDGLRRLSELAAPYGLNVIVENHGGLSSDGAWLAEVMAQVGLENCGTLPDFGNFYVARKRREKDFSATKEKLSAQGYLEDERGMYFDHYKGTELLMPYAKGVSAKSNSFKPDGEESHLDYQRLLNIVKASGYDGYIGIEYEGKEEVAGIKATKKLIEKYL